MALAGSFARQAVVVLSALWLLTGCGGRTQQALGGESNWLKTCSRDTDCSVGTCLCSVCTQACDGVSECSARGGGACVAPDLFNSEVCPGVVPPVSVCLPALTDGGQTLDSSDASKASVSDGRVPQPGDAAVDARPDVASERAECAFEFLGYWSRCEGMDDADEVMGATSVVDCMQACQQAPDCVGFNEYFWLGEGGDPSCSLVRGSCEEPASETFFEEDAARGFRIRCDEPVTTRDVKSVSDWQAESAQTGLRVTAESECVFEALGDSQVCEDFGILEFEPARGNSLQECLDACDGLPECTAVVDWWDGGPTEYECVLYTSTCDNSYRSLDDLRTLVKRCEP